MALSIERWPTFREMFPGIREDAVDAYGPAATLRLPGKHIAMTSRCLGNRDANFTGAVERFLSDSFPDAWWWSELLRKEAADEHPQAAAGLRSDDLAALLSTLSATSSAESPAREAPGAGARGMSVPTTGPSKEGSRPPSTDARKASPAWNATAWSTASCNNARSGERRGPSGGVDSGS